MVLVGILLLSGFALIAVEAIGYVRGGYGSEFWRLPLDDKLDHVAEHLSDWWWISIWSMIGIFTTTAGVAGLTALIANSGEPELAFVGLGGYLLAALAWVIGLSIQAAAISSGASQRAETGETPDWLRPLWNTAYVTEGLLILGSNSAFVVMGAALLGTTLLPAWTGWAAIAIGLAIILLVVIRRDGFPQLAMIVPAILGVALLIEAAAGT